MRVGYDQRLERLEKERLTQSPNFASVMDRAGSVDCRRRMTWCRVWRRESPFRFG